MMPPDAPRLTIVVPVKNEAGNIAPLVAEIEQACAGLPFEVIYVDDGSTDSTPAALETARAGRPWLRVLRHQASAGQSAAVRRTRPEARSTGLSISRRNSDGSTRRTCSGAAPVRMAPVQPGSPSGRS